MCPKNGALNFDHSSLLSLACFCFESVGRPPSHESVYQKLLRRRLGTSSRYMVSICDCFPHRSRQTVVRCHEPSRLRCKLIKLFFLLKPLNPLSRPDGGTCVTAILFSVSAFVSLKNTMDPPPSFSCWHWHSFFVDFRPCCANAQTKQRKRDGGREAHQPRTLGYRGTGGLRPTPTFELPPNSEFCLLWDNRLRSVERRALQIVSITRDGS